MPVSRRGLFAGACNAVLGAAALSILNSAGASVAQADGEEAGAVMPPLSSETAGRFADLGYDPHQVYATFSSVQAAFRAKDISKLSEVTSVPLLLKTRDSSINIQNAQKLDHHKAIIFSDGVRDVVLAQKFETLFLSSQGIMFGDGEISLQAICRNQDCSVAIVRIVTINVIK